MNRKRLGQFLIGGILTACAVVITALADLVSKEDEKQAASTRDLGKAADDKGKP
jgi:hypothetical protein